MSTCKRLHARQCLEIQQFSLLVQIHPCGTVIHVNVQVHVVCLCHLFISYSLTPHFPLPQATYNIIQKTPLYYFAVASGLDLVNKNALSGGTDSTDVTIYTISNTGELDAVPTDNFTCSPGSSAIGL